TPDARVAGPLFLLQALDAIDRRESVPHLITALSDLVNSPELRDPRKAPGHLAKLIELVVWRFELLVRSGALDDVLPRLTALPMLYSPQNGKGAAQWKQAKELFESRRVGQDSFAIHHGLEPHVARRIDYGTFAAHVARLLWQASLELPVFKTIRSKAN